MKIRFGDFTTVTTRTTLKNLQPDIEKLGNEGHLIRQVIPISFELTGRSEVSGYSSTYSSSKYSGPLAGQIKADQFLLLSDKL